MYGIKSLRDTQPDQKLCTIGRTIGVKTINAEDGLGSPSTKRKILANSEYRPCFV